MGRVYMFIFVVELILTITALISCLSAEDGAVRALPRIAWVIIILLFPVVGAVVYFAVGRPVTAARRTNVWRPGSGFPEANRPKPTRAPDDDPEFLESIGRASSRSDEELLRRWEEDLRRREDDLRRRGRAAEEPPSSDGQSGHS